MVKRYAELHCKDVEVRIKSLTITNLGEWAVTFNYTEEVAAQLEAMIAAYEAGQAESTKKNTWFQVSVPNMTKSFFVVAQPPKKLPMPEIGQNELLTIEITFTITEYKGADTAVNPT